MCLGQALGSCPTIGTDRPVWQRASPRATPRHAGTVLDTVSISPISSMTAWTPRHTGPRRAPAAPRSAPNPPKRAAGPARSWHGRHGRHGPRDYVPEEQKYTLFGEEIRARDSRFRKPTPPRPAPPFPGGHLMARADACSSRGGRGAVTRCGHGPAAPEGITNSKIIFLFFFILSVGLVYPNFPNRHYSPTE